MHPRCTLAILLSLPLTLAAHASGCGSGTGGSTTVTALPTLGGSQIQVNALAADGRVAGFSYLAGNQAAHAFLYANGAMNDLGTLGGATSTAYGLNAAGEVVGDSYLADGSYHAFVFRNGTLVDLGTLGGSGSTAACINDLGIIAGQSVTALWSTEAFIYTNNELTAIGDLGGGYSEAVAINQAGAVAGNSWTEYFAFHPFLYADGKMTDLGELGGGYTVCFALNDSGMVVGDGDVAGGPTHAFLYANGKMQDLGTLGGSYSSARAINNSGEVIGTAETSTLLTHGFIYSNGAMTDLGTLGGTDCRPAALNSLGQTVGLSATATGQPHAFLWQAGSITDLNSLLPAGSGWELTSAEFINDAGRIVGHGFQNGVYGTFVLDLGTGNDSKDATPPQFTCPAPVTLAAGTGCQAPMADLLAGLVVTDDCTPAASLSLSQSPAAGELLGLGQHTVTLTAADLAGNSTQCQVPVTVADQTPPEITSLTANPAVLDPPNHQLIPVTVSVVAADTCDAAPQSAIVEVTCNEAVLPGEIQIAGDLTVSLAATRAPSGSGRVYTIKVECRDQAGNAAAGTVTVLVPKNGNNKTKPNRA